MNYIVWRAPFKSYGYNQGDGYYVRYKDKCSDVYSPNWFNAKRYETIGPSITRLRLILNDSIKTMDDFYTFNKIDKSFLRDKTISKILDEDINLKEIYFEKGHIDKIDDNGNFIGKM
jgi:hypothetical protein